MTDRDVLLQRALKLESSIEADRERQRRVREIEASLTKEELQSVHDEARMRTIKQIGVKDFEKRLGSYSTMKPHFVREVIGEWYIDQKKPLESRIAEQVEV